MKHLADSAPVKSLHKFHPVKAELHLLRGGDMSTLDRYDKAIFPAGKNKHMQEKEPANERSAKFWKEKNKDDIAGAFAPERMRLLDILLPRAVTPLENANIYEVLKESEFQYRQIVETASEGIRMIGPCTITAQPGAANTKLESFAYFVSRYLRAQLKRIDGYVSFGR